MVAVTTLGRIGDMAAAGHIGELSMITSGDTGTTEVLFCINFFSCTS